MNQEVLDQPLVISDNGGDSILEKFASYLPAVIAIGGSVLLVLARLSFGGERFISDGALMMLALASYLIAAVFYLTNFYAPFRFAERLGLWAATLGVFFNFSSWLVRWVAAYDRELEIFVQQGRTAADMPWMFRYVPFANLYDLSLAFAFGAGAKTVNLLIVANTASENMVVQIAIFSTLTPSLRR